MRIRTLLRWLFPRRVTDAEVERRLRTAPEGFPRVGAYDTMAWPTLSMDFKPRVWTECDIRRSPPQFRRRADWMGA